MATKKIVLAITGTTGAGIDTLVECISTRLKINHQSARNLITEEIKKRNLSANKNSMNKIGIELREKNGSDFIVKTLYKRGLTSKEEILLIESVINPSEVRFLKSIPNIRILGVDADLRTRFVRKHRRGNEEVFISLNEFKIQENKDIQRLNLKHCINLADVVFDNGKQGTEYLEMQVEDYLLRTL